MPCYVIASLTNAKLIFKGNSAYCTMAFFFFCLQGSNFQQIELFFLIFFMVYSLSGKSRGLIIRSICLWLQQHTSAKYKFPLFFKKYAYLLLEDNKIWYYRKLQSVANEKMRTKTWYFLFNASILLIWFVFHWNYSEVLWSQLHCEVLHFSNTINQSVYQ